MNRSFLTNSLKLVIIAVLVFCQQSKADVLWHNDLVDVSVANQNIDIKGDNVLSEAITVAATSQDVLITITHENSSLERKSARPDTRLFLLLDNGYNITFKLDYNLDFIGASDGLLDIMVLGEGTVKFILANGKRVRFTSSGFKKGARLFLKMENSNAPKILFDRDDEESDEHVQVVVGDQSLIGYVASTKVSSGSADEEGIIEFDPKNSVNNVGRMVLRIEDKGGVYVGGNWLDGSISVTDNEIVSPYPAIDMAEPAGFQAQFKVKNGASHAGLMILNLNDTFTELLINPWFWLNTFTGNRYGFVLGANGLVNVGDNSYVDYVGLTNNFCPSDRFEFETGSCSCEVSITDCCMLVGGIDFCSWGSRDASKVVKKRNASAFIVDGSKDENAVNARIEFGSPSAIYFRSGVDRAGNINEFDSDMNYSFTVNFAGRTPCEGEIVFDIEGELDVIGDGQGSSALQVLSLEVTPTGGPVLIGGSEENFPKRTFKKMLCLEKYVGYNKAAFFINNTVNLKDTWLVHTDELHKICENNDFSTEPTYVGGESFRLDCSKDIHRPTIIFDNSHLYVHTSIAFTGLDLLVPNNDDEGGNDSTFKFFGNGNLIDDRSGRNMILGTLIGSCACDCRTVIDRDANLIISQETYQEEESPHILRLKSGMNDGTITKGVPLYYGCCNGIKSAECDCTECLEDPSNCELSIHTLYLGNKSNISIGSSCGKVECDEDLKTEATLSIEGNYFSFETRGGKCLSPELSSLTGNGGIFVDYSGLFKIEDCYRANVSTMVTRRGDGKVDLPKGKVFFDTRIAIADWRLDLRDSLQRLLVDTGSKISDYTIDWIDTIKDYDNFSPYEVGCYGNCCCPPVKCKNITSLPTVKGEVGQFQIKGSRLANSAHVMIDGGFIRELVFFSGCHSAEAPTSVVVLKNNGIVGIGSAHKNTDSLCASIMLGVNGVTIIANGDGKVHLNEDVIINNICHIIKGPEFCGELCSRGGITKQQNGQECIIQFYSDCCKELRVEKDGVLDLSSFTQPEQVVEFAGNIKLILEPGAKIVLGGGTLRFVDNACVLCSSVEDIENKLADAEDVTSTDDFRVDFVGTGTVVFDDCAKMCIDTWGYVGVVSQYCDIDLTDICFLLKSKSSVNVGRCCEKEGGVFQIGDTMIPCSPKKNGSPSVKFKMIIDGVDASFNIGAHSFFGLASGVVTNIADVHNSWLVGKLYNVDNIDIRVNSGTFSHERIFSGTDPNASLITIGDFGNSAIYQFTFDPIKATILGGANLFVVDSTSENPEVEDVATSKASIVSSKPLLDDIDGVEKVPPLFPTTAELLFNYLKFESFELPDPIYNPNRFSKVNAAKGEHNKTILGYVITNGSDQIVRHKVGELHDSHKITEHEHAWEQGAALAEFSFIGGVVPVEIYVLPY